MKRLWLFVSCIVLLLSGCLDSEKFSLSLDLTTRTAEVWYSNIVSNSTEEDKIKDDFDELIKIANGGREDQDGWPGKLISAKLYEKDGHLEGVARYSFKDNAEMLKEYDIETNNKGDFIFDISRGNDKDLEYSGGNGVYIEEGGKRFVRWNGNSTSLKVALTNKAFDAKDKGLLSYWLEWKKKNQK